MSSMEETKQVPLLTHWAREVCQAVGMARCRVDELGLACWGKKLEPAYPVPQLLDGNEVIPGHPAS